ncbi:MAG: LamG domain-containing protein, partial [Bacteroidetes bacterium]|nr:LamG domain-containing protein [Candidatus Cryptobacteroides merdavium]
VTVNPYELKLADNASSITVEGFANTASVAIARGNGGYRLADLTDDNSKYIKSAEIDEHNNIVVEANWLGTTTLTLSDNAGKTLEIPVTVAPVAAELSSDYCFRMGIREYIESHPDFDHQEKLTFEMVFWPTYSRSLQSFIGLEGVFLLRCESNGDTDLRFEIATNIHKDPYNLSGDTYNDPRFRSQQRMGNDRQGNAQWYHIAIVFDGTQSSTKEAYKMYINGVREELTPASDEYADVAPDRYLVLSAVKGDEALMIGRSGNSEYRLGYCAVAQARMWTVARTEAEIKADMCTYFSPEEAAEKEGLAGYWVPSEGTSGIDAFPNYGYVGEGLDGIVYNNAVKTITETPFTGKYRLVDCPYLVR